jgi:hypothetical protein
MKVEKQKAQFTPITITIESQEEFQLYLQLFEIAYDESEYDSPVEALAEKTQKALEEHAV